MASECAGRPETRPVSTSAHKVLACSISSGLASNSAFKSSARARICGSVASSAISFSTVLRSSTRQGWQRIAHLGERAEQAAEHFLRDHPIDPFGDPARRSLRDFVGEDVLVAGEPRLALFDRLRQERLRLTLRPHDRQQLRRHRRGRNRLRGLPRNCADQFADARQRQGPCNLRQLQRDIVSQPFGIGRLGEPPRERAHHIDARQSFVHHRGSKEIVGDETAERLADPLLVVRDDRRMRNRQAERMAEQSDDREPVGAGADHAGFGKSPQIGQPRPFDLDDVGRDEDRGHQRQQSGCEKPHPPQVAQPRRRDAGFTQIGGRWRCRRSSRSAPAVSMPTLHRMLVGDALA